MKHIIHYTLLLALIYFGPRYLGLVDENTSITTYVLWGAIFGGVGGVFLRMLFQNVFKN